jgi:hypothetical protein
MKIDPCKYQTCSGRDCDSTVISALSMLEIGCRVTAASIDSSDELRITCSRHQISQVKKKSRRGFNSSLHHVIHISFILSIIALKLFGGKTGQPMSNCCSEKLPSSCIALEKKTRKLANFG